MIKYTCDMCGKNLPAESFKANAMHRRRPYGWMTTSHFGKAIDVCSEQCGKDLVTKWRKENRDREKIEIAPSPDM